MAEARALVELRLHAYEASALLAFLQEHEKEFEDPDRAGGEELTDIAEALEGALPSMSYTPPTEEEEDAENA